jgi:hypothetical protein
MKILVGILLLFSTNAFAMTGGQLQAWCTDNVDPRATVACDAYISGTVDGMMFWWAKAIGGPRNASTGVASTRDAPYCPKDGLTVGESQKTVRDFLAKNRDLHEMPATVAIWHAMTLAYPCR